MAEPDEPSQLFLLTPGKTSAPAEKSEPRVEYDGPVRLRKAGTASEAPWWQRARQAEAMARSPQTDLSWGAIWLKLLASEGWIEGMRAGQRMMLEASVRGLDIGPGVVEAASASAKTKPQRVQLRLAALTSAEWARLIRQAVEDKAGDSISAGLHAGKIPIGLVDAADRHNVPLVPRRLIHVISACTCGGAQLPCDHVLAVHLVLGRKLDTDPLALLRFRGGDVDELLTLIGRVLEETQAPSQPTPRAAESDPFAPRDGPPPEWELLSKPPTPRAPLPLPEGWRGRETVDAVTRRILDGVRSRL